MCPSVILFAFSNERMVEIDNKQDLKADIYNCLTLHYITLHYTTLHYTTLHYTTLRYATLHYTTLDTSLEDPQ